MTDTERLYVELRSAAGSRRLGGVALVYGTELQIGRFRERWEPGAAEFREPALLNLEHRRLEPLAVARFTDNGQAVELAAELDQGDRQDAALADVRSGLLSGLSVEFQALEERMIAGVRVIVRGLIIGAALTADSAYPDTAIETRSRGRPRRPRWDRRLARWL